MDIISGFLNSLPGATAQGLIWGIMAIGVYITYKILDIADLTVDGSFCTGGAVCALLLVNDVPMYIALPAAFVAGILAGFVTGVFHTFFGIPAILAGILTQLGLYSINLHILGLGNDAKSAATLTVKSDKHFVLVSARYVNRMALNNPLWVTIIFVVIIIALLYWFFGTEIGAALRATGANGNMARAQGINTDKSKILGLMISNGFVALSGALFTQYNSTADVNMGRGAIVIGLAAVIIGEVVFSKIFHNFALKLLACALGSVIYYVVITLVLRLGLSTDDLKLLSAVVVALFLAAPYWKKKYFTKATQKGEN